MFINTFKFPNHSSLLRTMFTNTFNPPDQIASPRSVSATTLYTCNLKITIFYNSCGFGFLNIIPQWYLNIISQWYLSIIHFTDINEMTYLLSKQQFIHTVYDPNFGWQLECFLYLVYFPWKIKCKCTLQKEEVSTQMTTWTFSLPVSEHTSNHMSSTWEGN